MRNAVVALLFTLACSSKSKDPPAAGSDTKPTDPKPADPKPADPKPVDPKPAGSGSDAGSAGSGSDAKADPVAFDFGKLSKEEKVDFMKKEVVPQMKAVFQAFNAKEFAVFNCKTCHGKDPEKAKFKMPNPGLEKLDFAALKAGKQHPKEAKWMTEVVKPKMAAILKKPEMNEANPKGFGCLNCHEQKK